MGRPNAQQHMDVSDPRNDGCAQKWHICRHFVGALRTNAVAAADCANGDASGPVASQTRAIWSVQTAPEL